MPEPITKKQQAVLGAIEQYIHEKSYGPTVREICEMLGLSSPSTVHVHITALEEKGYINRDPMKSRSITLRNNTTPQASSKKPARKRSAVKASIPRNIVNVPLVGDVAAGTPILAQQNIQGKMPLPIEIVGDNPSFMLSVHGNSMVEAGINDGDYVVVKQQPVANNGDIVVALVENGATVKRFYKEKGHIRLQPENSSMQPILTDNCSIAGKVVAVFRRL